MASPYLHPKAKVYWFRKAVPEAIRHKVGKTILSISLKTRDPEEAKALFLEVALRVQKEWDALKPGIEIEQAIAPKPLTHMQRQGLAGEFRRWLISKHEDNPGAAAAWREAIERDRRGIWPSGRRPSGVFGMYVGQVEEFLDERGIIVQNGDIWDLVKAAGLAGLHAKETLVRHAEGDYSADPKAERYPLWEKVEPTLQLRDRALTVAGDWETYVKAGDLSLGTQKRWRPVLEKLGQFIGTQNLAVLTPDDIIRWKDALLKQGKKPSTVKEVYVAAGSSFFDWALDNRRVRGNPFGQVKIRVPKRGDDEGEPYGEEEAQHILSETLRAPRGRETGELSSAKRWIPWLCAYTGARVNEITQMRCMDLRKERVDGEEVWVLHITPEAGTVKTCIARDVPLHAHLVAQGFPGFVRSRGRGEKPVFYDPSRRRGGKDENPQSQKVGGRIAEWVRDVEAALEAAAAAEADPDERDRKLRLASRLQDKKVKPNHAWRHRFKTVARDCRMLPDVRDALQGHKPRTEGERYGRVSLKARWEEIKLIPAVEVSEPTGPAPKSRRAKREYESRKARGVLGKRRAFLDGASNAEAAAQNRR